MPLAAASERIVLPQREGRELLGHQDAPQVGMAGEADAEHVEDLALHPVGPGPEGDGRGEGRVGSSTPALTTSRSFVSRFRRT